MASLSKWHRLPALYSRTKKTAASSHSQKAGCSLTSCLKRNENELVGVATACDGSRLFASRARLWIARRLSWSSGWMVA